MRPLSGKRLRQLAAINDKRTRQPQWQRDYRQRQKRGEAMLRIRVGPKVVEALLVRGMGDGDSLDPKKVAAELAVVLEQWAAVWLK
jgi:hypothetical protein